MQDRAKKRPAPGDPGWLGYGVYIPSALPPLPEAGASGQGIDALADTGTQVAVDMRSQGVGVSGTEPTHAAPPPILGGDVSTRRRAAGSEGATVQLKSPTDIGPPPKAKTLNPADQPMGLAEAFGASRRQAPPRDASAVDRRSAPTRVGAPDPKPKPKPDEALSDMLTAFLAGDPAPPSEPAPASQPSPSARPAPRSAAPPRTRGRHAAIVPQTRSSETPPPSRTPLPPRSPDIELDLPGYHLSKLLGRGGMGEVFLADRLSTAGVAVRCVVKTILKDKATDPNLRKMFLDEAQVIALLRHPNVVSVMDVGEHDGTLFLAMEFIDGLDAGELVESVLDKLGRELPLKHMLYVIREALKGLHHAHTARGPDGRPLHIVHRDISPGNILVSRHGAVKVADFGVALGQASGAIGDADSVAGKPHYFAPEIWTGTVANPQTDVFAMGVTFWELLTSEPMFNRELGFYEVAGVARKFHPEQLLETHLSIPDGLEDIVIRALHPDPAQRYASALEFLEDINDYSYETGLRLLDAHFASFMESLLGEG